MINIKSKNYLIKKKWCIKNGIWYFIIQNNSLSKVEKNGWFKH